MKLKIQLPLALPIIQPSEQKKIFFYVQDLMLYFRYVYTPESDRGSQQLWGYVGQWYEGGGFIVDISLGSNYSEAIEELIVSE